MMHKGKNNETQTASNLTGFNLPNEKHRIALFCVMYAHYYYYWIQYCSTMPLNIWAYIGMQIFGIEQYVVFPWQNPHF